MASSDHGSDASSPTNDMITLTIAIPYADDLVMDFEFNLDDTVYNAKQIVLLEFNTVKIKDPLNFGFYQAPHNGRAGKFLDEERRLREYSSIRSQPFLEFRFKRRIYRALGIGEKKLHKINSKVNQKRFVEHVANGNAEKMKAMLEKGLDPNFHEEKTGETPLSLLVIHSYHGELLKAAVAYGGHIDFRCANGDTALHRATLLGNEKALKCLLDLGASPNLKDNKGLTPLYVGIASGANPNCCELLLHDHAQLEVVDHQGFRETHQACRNGRYSHLDKLIYYGADLNAPTKSGNTPLHIAAIYNQQEIIELLLLRGADKSLANHANQTSYDVAIIAGNKEAAELIRSFDGIEPFQSTPTYSGRRRGTASSALRPQRDNPLLRCYSESNMASYPRGPLHAATSLPDGQTLFPGRHGSQDQSCDSAASDSCDSDDEVVPTRRNHLRSVNDGLGAKRELPPMKISRNGSVSSRIHERPEIPYRRYLVTADFEATSPGELELRKGDIIEVLHMREQGYWEGRSQGKTGWFPSDCVQEVKKLKKARPKTWFGRKAPAEAHNTPTVSGMAAPRVVVLKRSEKGFGFQLRGANSHVPRIAFTPTPQYPALQYIGEVDKGGLADRSGIKPGDFILEINGENVINATHTHAVTLISKCVKSGVTLKVVTIDATSPEREMPPETAEHQNTMATRSGSFSRNLKGLASSVVNKKKGKKLAPKPPPRGHYGTLGGRSAFSGSCSSLLSDAGVTPCNNVDTVLMYNNRNSHAIATKSMWAESALRLRGPVVPTDGTAKPIRKASQDTTNTDRSRAHHENMDHYLTMPRNRTKKATQEPSSERRPPDYQYALENLRRLGRRPSYSTGGSGISDTATDPSAHQPTGAARPRPVSMIVSSASEPADHSAAAHDAMRSRQCSLPSGQPNDRKPCAAFDRSISEGGQASTLDMQLKEALQKRSMRTIKNNTPSDEAVKSKTSTGKLVSSGSTSHQQQLSPNSDTANSGHPAGRRDSKGSDYFSLYEASSNASLDSQCSKDSGVETSSVEANMDHEKALLNAIATRQAKMAASRCAAPAQLPTASTDECHVERTTKVPIKTPPPAVKPKPSQRKSSATSTGSGETPSLTPSTTAEDLATKYFDDVIADAEMSLDHDAVSVRSLPLLTVKSPPNEPRTMTTMVDSLSRDKITVPSEGEITRCVITPPPMFVDACSDDATLPPPPPEFLDDVVTIATSDNASEVSRAASEAVIDPPPPYSPPRPPVPEQSVAYKSWSCADVAEWLQTLSLGEYRETFVENDIRGSHLAGLTKDDLAELGVKKLGHRLTLDDAIAKLCHRT